MQMKKQQFKQIRMSLVATLALAISTTPISVQAATVTWIGGSSWWDYGSNWDSGAQPAPGDDVKLTQSDATDRVIRYYNTLYTTAPERLGALTINSTGTGTITLNQTRYAHPMYAIRERIGTTGNGAYVQSLGTNAAGYFGLGRSATGSGSYALSGTGTLSSEGESIGSSGSGVFIQSGGTNTIRNYLTIAEFDGSIGIYDLSGGKLSVKTETIGRLSTGTFTQSGGTHTVTNNLTLGALSSQRNIGSGNYDLSGGKLSVNTETIGGGNSNFVSFRPTGTFTQSGGIHTVTNDLFLGKFYGSTGTYTLSGGSLSVGGDIISGSGKGSLIINGGTLNVNGGDIKVNSLRFGSVSGTSVSHTLSDVDTITADYEYIGYNGAGTGTVIFTQSGGTHTVEKVLSLTGNNSRYDLSGGILSSRTEYIGYSLGAVLFTQSGGTHTVTNHLTLGWGYRSKANYDLSGGNLVARTETIGRSGTGVFTQSGGTHTVTNNLYFGENSTGTGTYNLVRGTLDVSGDIVNGEGTGILNIDGGTLNVAGGDIDVDTLTFGSTSGTNVRHTLSGSDTITAGNEIIGGFGTGFFTQTDSVHTVTNNLTLGQNAGSTGNYTLEDGILDVGGDIVNGDGASKFYINGGTLNVAGDVDVDILILGSPVGSSGNYLLTGKKTVTAGIEYIGHNGEGIFTQSGGSHTVANTLYMGSGSRGTGNYNLSGGALTVNDDQIIGVYGTATFTQSGGTHTVMNDLFLGYNSGATGTYTLSGGNLVVGGNIIDGDGASTLNIDGGTLNIAGGGINVDTLVLGSASGTNGNYTLSNMDTVTALNETIGDNGTGIFTQSGGTNTVTSNLMLGQNSGANGTYDLTNGTLNVGGDIINGAGWATLSIDGGTLNVAGGDIDVDWLHVGRASGSNGNYTLSSTGTVKAIYENIGYSGTGTFIQTGGTHTIEDTLNIGKNATGIGNYSLSGNGVLLAEREYVGDKGNGAFAQFGGTNSADYLTLGLSATGNGSYILTGGNLSVLNEGIGIQGTATFIQTGGVHAVTNTMTIAATTTGSGTYKLSGGTLTAGRIVNNDHFNYTGGSLNADITNNADFNLSGAGNRIVNGKVINSATGTVKTTETTVTWTGSFTNNGAYISDPSDNYFADLTVGETGYLVGGAGDNWLVNGDFTNNSLQNSLWNTDESSLLLNGSGSQNMSLAGVDLGTSKRGYNDNFAWGEFSLGSGISLNILDSNSDGDAAFYVGLVNLADGVDLNTLVISYIFSDYNIYYDPLLTGNAYLNGLTFALNGRGFLTPSSVPVPPAVWLFASGLLGLIAVARQQKA